MQFTSELPGCPALAAHVVYTSQAAEQIVDYT